MKIQIYRDHFDQTGAEVELSAVIEGIRCGRWMDKVLSVRLGDKDAKASLPAVTFAGTFSHRKIEGLKEYSSLMVLDFDNVLPMDPDRMTRLRGDEYTRYLFISPGGKGLKIVVQVAGNSSEHIENFKALTLYFKLKHDLEVDKSGKDICRLCYVSFDEDMITNPFSSIFNYASAAKQTVEERPVIINEGVSDDPRRKFIICISWTERNFSYAEGQRNGYIHNLACNCNRVGIKETEAFDLICRYYDLEQEEIKRCVRSAYKNTSQHNIVTLFSQQSSQNGSSQSIVFIENKDAYELLKINTMRYARELSSKSIDKQIASDLMKAMINHDRITNGFSEDQLRELLNISEEVLSDSRSLKG